MWQEQDHPRDEDGKFTFKNGGGNNNSTNTLLKGHLQINDEKSGAQALFRNTKIQKEIEHQKQKTKNELLDILGNKKTQADVLYGSEESLKKKIKEYGLKSFQKDTEQHEILRQLSVYCYDDGKQSIPKGYERIGHFEGKNNGFDAVVVKNDAKKEIVIAYRGMEHHTKDVLSTLRAGALNYTSQQKAAQAVYEKIKQDKRFKDYEIQTTGQSLGGYLAQYVAAKNNLKSATFNAYHGAKEALGNEAARNFQTKIIHPDNIVNYRNKEDILSKSSTKNNLGLSLETHAEIKKKSLNKFEEPHMSENMGKLDNARVKNEIYDNYATVKDELFIPIIRRKIQNSLHDKLN